MIEISIPGRGDFQITHVVFDVNGTLATDGTLLSGVAGKLTLLRERAAVHLLTADTHGGQAAIDETLGFEADRVAPGGEAAQKARFVENLGSEKTVAIGNGANDAGMLNTAGIGIAVLGEEGLCVETLNAADVLVGDIHDALDLLLKPERLVATLRR
jgi:P-type E1-E2 ATPase